MNVILTIKALQKLHIQLIERDEEYANVVNVEFDGDAAINVEVRPAGKPLYTKRIKLSKAEIESRQPSNFL